MDSIEVRIWGRSVGAVGRDPTSGRFVFEYMRDWVNQGVELAPLTMPLSGAGALPGSRRWVFTDLGPGFRGLPGLVADALPDAFGNSLINAYLQTRGRRAEDITMIDRLAYMGKRAMGALEFKPPTGPRTESHKALDMAELVEEARRAVRGDLSNDQATASALKVIIRVGTSAGGARPKAVIAWNPKTNQIVSGQFEAPPGYEHWLLKFDGVDAANADLGTPEGYGRIEYAYYLMADAAGIDMMPSHLREENGRAHFMTKRFDRAGNAKHHVQTLCAVRHLDYQEARVHAYEQLFDTIASIVTAPDDRERAMDQAFRRMALNQMASNHDDHTKNTAFILRQGQGWRLAPAYDVTYAYKEDSKWVSAHQMSVNGKFSEVTREDMITVARRFGIPGARGLLDEVAAAVSEWSRFAAKAGVPPERARALFERFRLG